MVRSDLVRRRVRLIGSGVNGDAGEAVSGVEKIVLRVMCDGVRLAQRGVRVDGDLDLGVQLMSDPADLDRLHPTYAFRMSEVVLDQVDQGGVDGVHEPAVDLARGGAQHAEDGDGDEQPDDGVGPAASRARRRPRRAARRGEVKPSVRACSPSATRAAEPIARPTRMR